MLGWREQATARRGGVGPGVLKVRIGEAVQWRAGGPVGQAPIARAALAHRVCQGNQVVLVGMGG